MKASSKPSIRRKSQLAVQTRHSALGEQFILLPPSPGVIENVADVQPQLMFTENETNVETLYGSENAQPYVKDAFHKHIVDGADEATNPSHQGTKSCAWFAFDEGDGIPPGEFAVVRFRLSRKYMEQLDEEVFDHIIERRREEANEFYRSVSQSQWPMTFELSSARLFLECFGASNISCGINGRMEIQATYRYH